MPRMVLALAVCLCVPVLLSAVGLSLGLRDGLAAPPLSIPHAAERPTAVPMMPPPPLRILPPR